MPDDKKGTGTLAAALIAAVAAIVSAVLSARGTLDKQLLEQYGKMIDYSQCKQGELGPLCASRLFVEKLDSVNNVRSQVANAGILCRNDTRVETCVADFVQQDMATRLKLADYERWIDTAGKNLNCVYPADPSRCKTPTPVAIGELKK